MDDLKEYDILIKTIIENKQEFMTIKNISKYNRINIYITF